MRRCALRLDTTIDTCTHTQNTREHKTNTHKTKIHIHIHIQHTYNTHTTHIQHTYTYKIILIHTHIHNPRAHKRINKYTHACAHTATEVGENSLGAVTPWETLSYILSASVLIKQSNTHTHESYSVPYMPSASRGEKLA